MNTPGASPAAADRRKQVEDQYAKYLGDLARLLRIGASGTKEERLAQIQHEVIALENDVRGGSGAVSATDPSRCVPDAPGAEQPAATRRIEQHEELGLSAFAAEWPADRVGALREVERDVAAVLRLWGPAPDRGGEPARFLRGLADRREVAVLFASSAAYAAARRSGLSADSIDACAERFAQFLGERLFGSPTRVFAVRRGPIRDAEHELVGGPTAFGLVRCVAFGMRGPRGEIACKALVESDQRVEDA